jgi:SPP1 family predicted phage head-tail adaptor
MNPGDLRHRIQIQAPNQAQNPFAAGSAWTTTITMWARVQPLSSKEVFQAGAINMKVTHKITIRYPGTSVTISAGNRVLYKNRAFNLLSGIMNADERNILLDLMAFEINPNQ